MSKRVTLTAREIEYIVNALIHEQKVTTLDYQVIKVGIQVYEDIINKLNKPTNGKLKEKKGE